MTDGIRFVALGAVRRDDELLVWEGESPSGEPFYRLLGGGVEFDEHSREAVVREFDEELGVELLDPTAVSTYERVFERGGDPAHEVWRVYEGRIAEDWPYADESFAFVEPERGTEHVARWLPIERLRHPDVTFYVPEILDALTH